MSYESEHARLQKLLQFYQDLSSCSESSGSDTSENCNDFELQNRTMTSGDEEISEEENSEEESNENVSFYLGRDKKTKWMKSIPPKNVRTRSCNIVSHLPGVKGCAKNVKEPEECFLLFLDDTIIRKMTEYTNIYIASIADKYSRERDAKSTSESEIKTLIGLLILAGVCRSGHQNLEDLWDQSGFGVDIFYSTMSLHRFLFLQRCLRFDDVRSREIRRETDKLSAFREIFELFLENCSKHYTLAEYTTIDEQLVPFRGRTKLRQYIPSKPAKYGLKIWTICDARTWYTHKMEVYVGNQPDGQYKVSNSPTDVVKRLVQNIEGSGRNITCDNLFSSVPLAAELQKKNLTIVGTLRKNKREIPNEFISVKDREINSSLFGFANNMTLVSYFPKKSKNVILLSTMHHNNSIDASTGEAKKPEIITMYNLTKTGVDTVDEMCGTYSTSRKCRRWPLVLFYRVLDIAGINAQIVFTANNPNTNVVRRKFLREMGMKLIKPSLQKRASTSCLPKTVRHKAAKLSHTQPLQPATTSQERSQVARRCVVCPRMKDIKTKSYCSKCCRPMCLKHMKSVCEECIEQSCE